MSDPTPPLSIRAATESIFSVGDGRGFLLAVGLKSYVVTAAHCLTQTPDGSRLLTPPAADSSERTYAEVLGPLNGPLTVWAECQFFDPIADLAVLGPPMVGDQQYDAFYKFVEERDPLSLGSIDPNQPCAAWLLTLEGRWQMCMCEAGDDRTLLLKGAVLVSGMSGSPILDDDGTAIGVVGAYERASDKHPQPRLARCLPGWFLTDFPERLGEYRHVTLRCHEGRHAFSDDGAEL